MIYTFNDGILVCTHTHTQKTLFLVPWLLVLELEEKREDKSCEKAEMETAVGLKPVVREL